LGYAVPSEERADLPSNLVASVVDWDIASFFALEMDLGDVEQLACVLVGPSRLLRRGILGGLRMRILVPDTPNVSGS
jgi:hypothetical protein